jgi:hypothetical protein
MHIVDCGMLRNIGADFGVSEDNPQKAAFDQRPKCSGENLAEVLVYRV